MDLKTDIQAAAADLAAARASRVPIPAVRHRLPAKDVDAAYAVQKINVARRLAGGARIVGRKIGLTSEAVQRQLGVDQPDFGVLFQDMDVAPGATVKLDIFIAPRIEGEIAFRMAADVTSPGHSRDELAARIEAAAPALEIVDSAIAHWDIDIVDTIADNASCGAFVVGGWRPYTQEMDLPSRRMRLTRNGAEVSIGVGAATLGDPLNALAWLTEALIAVGDPLRAGEIVLAGALGPMTPFVSGDYVLEIDGLDALFVRAIA